MISRHDFHLHNLHRSLSLRNLPPPDHFTPDAQSLRRKVGQRPEIPAGERHGLRAALPLQHALRLPHQHRRRPPNFPAPSAGPERGVHGGREEHRARSEDQFRQLLQRKVQPRHHHRSVRRRDIRRRRR